MNIENYIESQYRELQSSMLLSPEYLSLYEGVESDKLREVLASLHKVYIDSFVMMNERLPTRSDTAAHFWAEPSRKLLRAIEVTMGLHRSLRNSKFGFEIDEYYGGILLKCQSFLRKSGGSVLPENMEKVDLYYTVPIFLPASSLKMVRNEKESHYQLKLIGGGSYARIFKFRDEQYNKDFALKRAKKDLSPKELERFRREFDAMSKLSYPYILEVYSFDESRSQYIMELMDFSLDEFIQLNNSKLQFELRRSIAQQILKAFAYLHSKGLIHRDISPKNVLLKQYEDICVVKISDFGLVKTPNSALTSANTEFKGYFNDPALMTEGFDSYSVLHETYALTKLLFFVMTGRTNTSEISDPKMKEFVQKGLHPDTSKRFQSIDEVAESFRSVSVGKPNVSF